MIRLIASLPVGSVAAIDLLREGQHRSARVKLEERQDDNPGGMRAVPAIPDIPRGADKNDDPKGKGRKSPSLGMSLRPLTSDIAKPRGLDGVRGLYVAGVEPGSPAADAGIRVDDVITEVNDRPIGSMNDFSRLTKGVQSGTEIQIKVLRRSRGLLRMAQIVSVAAQ
jgi:serine protease Do